MNRYFLLALLAPAFCSSRGAASDGLASVSNSDRHPYQYLPAYGHASENPGSPKYFEPGYGYRIPGFGFRGQALPALPRYGTFYEFGRRVPGLYSDERHRYWMNSYGGPWNLPGSPSNTQTRWPAW